MTQMFIVARAGTIPETKRSLRAPVIRATVLSVCEPIFLRVPLITQKRSFHFPIELPVILFQNRKNYLNWSKYNRVKKNIEDSQEEF